MDNYDYDLLALSGQNDEIFKANIKNLYHTEKVAPITTNEVTGGGITDPATLVVTPNPVADNTKPAIVDPFVDTSISGSDSASNPHPNIPDFFTSYVKLLSPEGGVKADVDFLKTGHLEQTGVTPKDTFWGGKPGEMLNSTAQYLLTDADIIPHEGKSWGEEVGQLVKFGVQTAAIIMAVNTVGSIVGLGSLALLPILGSERIASLVKPIAEIGADFIEKTPFLKTAFETSDNIFSMKLIPFLPKNLAEEVTLRGISKNAAKDFIPFNIVGTANEVGTEALTGHKVDVAKAVKDQLIQNTIMFGVMPTALHATGYTLKGAGGVTLSILDNAEKIVEKSRFVSPFADLLRSGVDKYKNGLAESIFFGLPLSLAEKIASHILSVDSIITQKQIAALKISVPKLFEDENFQTLSDEFNGMVDLKFLTKNPEQSVSSLMVLESGRLYSFMKEAPDLYNKHIELFAHNQYQNVIRKYSEEYKELTEAFPEIFSFNRDSVKNNGWEKFLLNKYGAGYVYGLNKESANLIKGMMGKSLTENALEKIRELIPNEHQAEMVLDKIKEVTDLRADIISFLDKGLPKSIPGEMQFDVYKAKQKILNGFKSGKINDWNTATRYWNNFADKMASPQIDSKISEIDSLLKESVENSVIENRIRVSRYFLKGKKVENPEFTNVFEFKRERVALYTKALKKRIYETIYDRAIADNTLRVADNASITKTLIRGDNEARFYNGIVNLLKSNPGRKIVYDDNIASVINVIAPEVPEEILSHYDTVSFGGKGFYIEKNTSKFLNQQGNLLFGNNSVLIDKNIMSRIISSAKAAKTSMSPIHFSALSMSAIGIGQGVALGKTWAVLLQHLGKSGVEYIDNEVYNNINVVSDFMLRNKEKFGYNPVLDTFLTNITSTEQFRQVNESGFISLLKTVPGIKQFLNASLFLEDTLWNKFVPLLKTNVARQMVEKGEAAGRDPKAIFEDIKKIPNAFGGQPIWQYATPQANMWLRMFAFAPDWYLTLVKHATRSMSGDELFSVFYARLLSIRMLLNNAFSITYTGKTADERFAETHDIRDLGRTPLRVETVSANGRITKKDIYIDFFGFETEGMEFLPVLPLIGQIVKNISMITHPSTTIMGLQKTIMGTLDDTMKFYMSKGGVAMNFITPIIQHKNSEPVMTLFATILGSFAPIGASGLKNAWDYRKIEPQASSNPYISTALLYSISQAGIRIRTSEKLGEEAYTKWMATTSFDDKMNGNLGPVVTDWFNKNNQLFGSNVKVETLKRALYAKLVKEYYGISVRDIKHADPDIKQRIINQIKNDPTLLKLVQYALPSFY